MVMIGVTARTTKKTNTDSRPEADGVRRSR